jgi:hypothetical protein
MMQGAPLQNGQSLRALTHGVCVSLRQATGEQARIWHHLFKALARVGNDLFLQVNDKQVFIRPCDAEKGLLCTQPAFTPLSTVRFPTFLRPYGCSF